MSFLANTLVAKQLQILQGLLPGSGTIGFLVNLGNPNAESDSKAVQTAARTLRLQVHIVHTAAVRDLDAAFAEMQRAQVAAILIFPDPLFISARGRLVDLAARYKLPVLYPDRSFVGAGA